MSERMKENLLTKIIFLLSLVCLFLPWFTMNRTEQTPMFGWYLLPAFAITYTLIAVYLFAPKQKAWMRLSAIMAGAMQVLAAIYAMGRWQYWWHISGKTFDLSLMRRAAQPEFWISITIYVILLISLIVSDRAIQREEAQNPLTA